MDKNEIEITDKILLSTASKMSKSVLSGLKTRGEAESF